jgi:hypothetical protein
MADEAGFENAALSAVAYGSAASSAAGDPPGDPASGRVPRARVAAAKG